MAQRTRSRGPRYPAPPLGPGAFTYLERIGGFYKLGHTGDLYQREPKITVGTPREHRMLVVAGWFVNGEEREAALKQQFAGSRVDPDRELFDLTATQVDGIVTELCQGKPHYLAKSYRTIMAPTAETATLDWSAARQRRQRRGQRAPATPSHSAAPIIEEADSDAPTTASQLLNSTILRTVERQLRAEYAQHDVQPWYIEAVAAQRQYPGCVVLIQRGRQFQAIGDDAHVAAAFLNLGTFEKTFARPRKGVVAANLMAPAVAVGVETAARHIDVLARNGLHVVQINQVGRRSGADEMPGGIQRDLTRIYTPGTRSNVVDVDVYSTPALVAALCADEQAALTMIDVTTGLWRTLWWVGPSAAADLNDEIDRIDPAELLIPPTAAAPLGWAPLLDLDARARYGLPYTERELVERFTRLAKLHGLRREYRLGRVTRLDSDAWEARASDAFLATHFGANNPFDGHSGPGVGLAHITTAAAFRYLESTHTPAFGSLRLESIGLGSHRLVLDGATRRNLELTSSLSGGQGGALLGAIDETMTAMGARELKRRLLAPSTDRAAIERRLDAVEAALADDSLRGAVRGMLREIEDLERYIQPVADRTARPWDLRRLHQSLRGVAVAAELLAASAAHAVILPGDSLDPCIDVADLIDAALADQPEWPAAPVTSAAQVERLIRRGWSEAFDARIDDLNEAQQLLDDYAAQLPAELDTADVQVIRTVQLGHVIDLPSEVAAPDHFWRVRHLKPPRGRLYYKTEMLERSARALETARTVFYDAEIAAYEALISALQPTVERVEHTARRLAQLDVVLSFAEYARRTGGVRPMLDDAPVLYIEDGRHPTVERLGNFVANTVALGGDAPRQIILTGPNAGGKSTLMRMVAALTLLAHVGSFLPARSARIGIVDRIFTRIGAQDDIAHGMSTFQVELAETRVITSAATARSLVIVDETGRGTSTYEGIALARSLTRYLLESVGCRTIVATHYPEVAAEANGEVARMRMGAVVGRNHLDFTYRLEPGIAERSYGLMVARQSGLPAAICDFADQLYAHFIARSRRDGNGSGDAADAPLALTLRDYMRNIQVEELRPLDAQALLGRLVEAARGERALTELP